MFHEKVLIGKTNLTITIACQHASGLPHNATSSICQVMAVLLLLLQCLSPYPVLQFCHIHNNIYFVWVCGS